MHLIVIAGPAGSGKTTLADLVAGRLHAPHLDFDVVTNGVVTAHRQQSPHLSEPELLEAIKDQRYAELAAAVRSAFEAARQEGRSTTVVTSAPFTSISRSSASWADWLAGCGEPDRSDLFWLDIDPELRLARVQQRASSRDARLLEGSVAPVRVPPPLVAHHLIDAELPLDDQATLVIRRSWD